MPFIYTGEACCQFLLLFLQVVFCLFIAFCYSNKLFRIDAASFCCLLNWWLTFCCRLLVKNLILTGRESDRLSVKRSATELDYSYKGTVFVLSLYLEGDPGYLTLPFHLRAPSSFCSNFGVLCGRKSTLSFGWLIGTAPSFKS